MGNQGTVYDTAAIRREAMRFQRCFNRLDEAALPRMRQLRVGLNDSFQGQTARALDDALEGTQRQLITLRGDLRRLYLALMAYADALEEADNRVAQLMGK